VTSGAGSPRAFLGKNFLGPARGGDAARNAEADGRRTEEHREGGRVQSEAEEVLLADALAVRLILSRMEQAVEQGIGKRLP
jgi:hypothetical protein